MHHPGRASSIAPFVALALVAWADAPADDNEIFTCRDEHGNVSFQNDPCPEPSIEKGVTTTAPAIAPPPQTTIEAIAPLPQTKIEPVALPLQAAIKPVVPTARVVEVASPVVRVSTPVPKATAKPASKLAFKPTSELASKPTSKPASKQPSVSVVERARKPKPPTTHGLDTPSTVANGNAPTWWVVLPYENPPPIGTRKLARQSFPVRLGAAAKTSVPGFGSPEQAWRTFLSAVENGDRAGAVACLSSTARERIGLAPEAFPLERVREMVAGFNRIEDGGDLGPFWSARGVRGEKRRPKWIFFEEIEAGQWRIAGI